MLSPKLFPVTVIVTGSALAIRSATASTLKGSPGNLATAIWPSLLINVVVLALYVLVGLLQDHIDFGAGRWIRWRVLRLDLLDAELVAWPKLDADSTIGATKESKYDILSFDSREKGPAYTWLDQARKNCSNRVETTRSSPLCSEA